MKNKIAIITLGSIVAALCLYFLSFTLLSNSVKSDAEVFATDAKGTVDYNKKQAYLDSLWTKPAFEFLGGSWTYKEIKEQELHLGLDLQGGMHVVIEVSPVEIVRTMAGGSTDPNFVKAIETATEKTKNSQETFVRLFASAYKEINPDVQFAQVFSASINKSRITINSSNEEVLKAIELEVEDAIGRSFNILRTRIDKFGVTQPNIQRLKGTGRIQLELPGVDNPERVRKLLSGTAKLEFVEVYEGDKFGPYFETMNKFLVKLEKKDKNFDVFKSSLDTTDLASDVPAVDTTKKAVASNELFAGTKPGQIGNDSIGLAGSKSSKEVAKADSASKTQSKTISKLFVPMYGGVGANVVDTGKVNKLFNMPEIKALLPSNMRILWAVKGIKAEDGNEFLPIYFVKKSRGEKAALDGDVITNAYHDVDPTSGKWSVGMQMNPNGAKKWRAITRTSIGRRIAIVLDGFVYSAPVVQGEIPNGSSNISGDFSVDEAKDLANILKAGKLPAPTRIVEEAVIGPSLGKEAITSGINSSLIGLVAVIIFMVFYYSTGGFVADIALFINLFFILGILTQMQAVLTLPGIAGIVLTMGMAVDANVLIYERIREEIAKGKSLMQAINDGFSKANSSIVDGNVTTFLVGIILAAFGSGPVQGFAVTLMIGIVTSFFTSVFISRLVIEWWAKGKNASALNFSTRMSSGFFKNTNYNVVGSRRMSYIFSLTVIVAGFVCIFAQGGLNLGVDFKGGRSYVVQFNEAIPAAEVREKVISQFKGMGTEVKTYGSDDKLKITTSYLADDETEVGDKQVIDALQAGLGSFSTKNPQILSTSKVGATIADDIKYTSLVSMLLALAGIFLYIFIRFRKFWYSVGAILALTHDVLITIALTGIVGIFGLSIEIDQIYIAAILTVIGYSINDTVVVFDRLREFLNDNPKAEMASTINVAINNTFSRTIITAMTVFLVVFVLYLFGGEILKGFSFVMLCGVVFGSYSSIFIASPIVVDLANMFKSKKEVELPVKA
ncbi:MAG: protein translocase subunit SecDF [Cytophagales bacterium]|nr:MAG: protein translocase subunit SecDF [Cytophagales bacterium]